MQRVLALAAILFVASSVWAQHDHMQMHMQHAAGVKLDVTNDAAAETLTVRLGPLNLPAHSTHMQVAQPPVTTLEIPFDGWITAYHPRLVDDAGKPVPSRLLHHVAFWNAGRSDFLCPNKMEHIFGAGGEMNDWPALPGIGYRVHKGDKILITSMFHNPTAVSYPKAYLEVRMEYKPADAGLKSVYPAWIDVKECGDSGYDLTPGKNVNTGTITVNYPGRLLGVGGHMHDYGQELELNSAGDTIATLPATLDDQGHITGMPIVTWADTGGLPLAKGQVLEVTAIYDNPTGKFLPEGAMGIVVGYFLPANDAEMSALVRSETSTQ